MGKMFIFGPFHTIEGIDARKRHESVKKFRGSDRAELAIRIDFISLHEFNKLKVGSYGSRQ
jgi:hypothetical protein